MKKIINSLVLFFLLLTLPCPLLSNDTIKIDSLQKIIRAKSDTGRIGLLLALSEEYQNKALPEKAMESAIQAQKEAEKFQYKAGIARSFYRQGALLSEKSDFQGSIDHFMQTVKLAEEIRDLTMQADGLSSIGGIYRRMGRYPEGLNYFFRALKMYEKLGRENEEKCMMGIGIIYSKQKNYTKALEYLSKALETAEKNGNLRMKSRILVNLGVNSFHLKNYEKAIEYYEKVLEPAEKLNDLSMQQASLSNIGGIYIMLEKYQQGQEYCSRALAIAKKQGDKENIVITTGNIGEAYSGMKKYDQAEKHYREALRLSQEIGLKDITKEIYLMLSQFYEKKGDYKNAYTYFQSHAAAKDTLLNKENSRIVTEMDTKYQTEKKQKQIEFQQLELSRQKADLNKQRVIIFSTLGGVVLLVLLAFLLYNRNQLKKKANQKLRIAYKEIEEKNKEIEKTNLQITDSIEYAQRIQEAILPGQDEIQHLFPESFVLFRPRDVVSGDFYWYSAQNSRIVIVVADCTGHGVPGAFMSMIGSTLLNEIVNEKKVTDPGRILEYLNEGIIHSLHQDKESSSMQHDGMEIGICSIDLAGKELSFAGSGHNLYLFKNGKELIEVKGDRFDVGGQMHKELKVFTSHLLSIADGVTFYLATDGFIDQSGGSNNKRFTSAQFKELLINLQNHPLHVQKQLMESEFEKWKGLQKQKDDVLVMGIKCCKLSQN